MSKWMSQRTRNMPASIFATMDAAKRKAREKGLELIDLSIGSSDLKPPEAALAALREATRDPKTYGYCLKSGTLKLRETVQNWFQERYALTLDVDTNITALIGSQEGLANLLFATCDPGDTVLLPDPCYPSYYGAVAAAGLNVHKLPLRAENDFLPDFDAVSEDVVKTSRVLVLSYPNNPTASVASQSFLQTAVDFCRRHDILFIHDFPYVDMVYGDYEAPSVLSCEGAFDTAVELYSCSKSYHMGGFRIGWALGNANALTALEKLKGAIDFNQYVGIQQAAVAALKQPRERVRRDAAKLESRRDTLVTALNSSGWNAPLPKASMYVWTPLPAGLKDDFNFSLELVETTGVCLAPGRAFGTEGEGYVRFALVREPEVLVRAVEKMDIFIKGKALPI